MTKEEILEVLNIMLIEWEKGLKEPLNINLHKDLFISNGFCYWLSENITTSKYFQVFNQLIADRKYIEITNRTFLLLNYWYIVPQNLSQKDDLIRSFQYRIDHLKRTIARLEQELQN